MIWNARAPPAQALDGGGREVLAPAGLAPEQDREVGGGESLEAIEVMRGEHRATAVRDEARGVGIDLVG